MTRRCSKTPRSRHRRAHFGARRRRRGPVTGGRGGPRSGSGRHGTWTRPGHGLYHPAVRSGLRARREGHPGDGAGPRPIRAPVAGPDADREAPEPEPPTKTGLERDGPRPAGTGPRVRHLLLLSRGTGLSVRDVRGAGGSIVRILAEQHRCRFRERNLAPSRRTV